MRGQLALIVLAASGLILTACTTVHSSFHIIQADQALQKAKSAEAERLAPYQFTMSQEYLNKARSEAADSDHKIAMQLAKKSAEWADQAIIAIENRGMKTLSLDADELLPEAGEVDLLGDEP